MLYAGGLNSGRPRACPWKEAPGNAPVWLYRIALADVFLAAGLPKIAHPHDFARRYRYQLLPYGLVNICRLDAVIELIAPSPCWRRA